METIEPPVRVGRLGDGEATACVTCGEGVLGAYCHTCGERQPRPEDVSLGHVLREQFQEVTSADGRLWRTFCALPIPGKLTEEYLSGRRSQYVRPVRLFLVVNVALFLVLIPMGGEGFRGGASIYRNAPAFSARMDTAAQRAGVEVDVYDAAFDQHADTLSRTLIALLVPLFAIALGLVMLPARRGVVRHLVFSTHFIATFLAATVVVAVGLYLFLLLWVGVLRGPPFVVGDPVMLPILVTMWAGYLVVGLRRVYAVPWWGATLAAGVLGTAGIMTVMEAYRTILFYATVWTLDLPV